MHLQWLLSGLWLRSDRFKNLACSTRRLELLTDFRKKRAMCHQQQAFKCKPQMMSDSLLWRSLKSKRWSIWTSGLCCRVCSSLARNYTRKTRGRRQRAQDRASRCQGGQLATESNWHWKCLLLPWSVCRERLQAWRRIETRGKENGPHLEKRWHWDTKVLLPPWKPSSRCNQPRSWSI